MTRRALTAIALVFAGLSCQRLSPEERMVVGTWESLGYDHVSYTILNSDHSFAYVSDWNTESKGLELDSRGTWRVDGDDLVAEAERPAIDDSNSQPEKSIQRVKIAEFIKSRTRHAPVSYRTR
jgi:hypothetical protein